MNHVRLSCLTLGLTLIGVLDGPRMTPTAKAQPLEGSTKTGYIDVDGGRIYYEEAGDGPAIVLIHDGLVHSEVWDAQFRELAQHHRVIRYDRRGYGRSIPEPTEAYSNVDDLHTLLESLHVERAVLMGSSSGGGLAIDYAIAHPERVIALVLSGPVVDGLWFSTHFIKRNIAIIDQDAERMIELCANDPYTIAPGNTTAREKMRRLLADNPHNLKFDKYRFQKESSTPALRRLSEILVPTLIIVGAEDIPDVHAHAGAIEAGIAGAVRKIIPDAGHLSYLERPEAFNRIVQEFLSLISLQLEYRLATGADPDRADATPPSFARGFAKVGWTYLYYETLGTGHPLVMVHGGGIDHRMWDDQFAAFGRKYKVIRYDAEGHGLTKFGAASHRPHDDLRDLLNHLGIERAHVMGLSMGGRIVIDFALEHPQMVSALIPVGPGLSGYDFNSEAVATFLQKLRPHLRAGNTEAAVDVFLQSWTIGPKRSAGDVDAGVRSRVRAMLLEGFQPGKSQGEGQWPVPPAIGRLSEIKAPTLIVIGEEDMPDILDIGNKLKAGIAGSELVLVPDAAHMVNMERPELFDRTVLEFLARH